MKKIIAKISILLAIIILLTNCKSQQYKRLEEQHYNAQNIYVYCIDDKKEIFEKKSTQKVSPASLTKIMTAYLSIQETEDINKIAPVDKKTYQKLVRQNASMAGFYGNEKTTYKDLLYGAILPSGGESADSLAINVSGTKKEFVNKMNTLARELKMENTKFKNPDGMDEEGQYSSAKDIATLLNTAIKNEKFYKIITQKNYLSTKTINHPKGVYMESTVLGKLEKYEQKDFKILGGKSGTTDNAGLCWATISEKSNKKYIIVVMGVPFDNIKNTGDGQIQDTIKILENL